MKKSGSHLPKMNFVQLFYAFFGSALIMILVPVALKFRGKLSLISKKVSQVPLEGFLHGWVKTAANGMV